MKINYIVLLNVLNKSLLDNDCDILDQYTNLELTNSSAEVICKQIECSTNVHFKSVQDASNPDIISTISSYYSTPESHEQFHKTISNKTIMRSTDIDGDGTPENTLITTKDIEDMSNEVFRTKMTSIICIGVLLACFSYIFAVTFCSSLIDPDNNARFVDQILSNINSVINMIVMFIINIFFLGNRYSKDKKENPSQS